MESKNININMEVDWEAVRTDVFNAVKDQIEAAGGKVVDTKYNAAAEIKKLTDRAVDLKLKADHDIAYNNQRYSPEVATSKNNVVTYMLQTELRDMSMEVEQILEKDKEAKETAIKKGLADERYVAARKDIIALATSIKDVELDIQLLQEIISPIVEHQDRTYLKLLKAIIKDNTSKYVIQASLDAIEDVETNSLMSKYAAYAKDFILTGGSELSMQMYQDYFNK